MTYEPPTNPSLWQVLLADEEGYVTTAAAALDEYGPESHVEISIRRLTALPVPQVPGAEDEIWELPGTYETADVAVEWRLDMVDDIGELDHIAAQLKTAQAMAAGLNGALVNDGGWNCGTELAATLHDLADKLAVYTGPLTRYTRLSFHFIGETDTQAVANVDLLGLHLIGTPGNPIQMGPGNWRHQAAVTTGGLKLEVFAGIPAPDEENPAALKARIAELEAKLAGGAQ